MTLTIARRDTGKDTETIVCAAWDCETTIGNDIFGGWVSVWGTAYLNPDTHDLYCPSHAEDADVAVEGEVQVA